LLEFFLAASEIYIFDGESTKIRLLPGLAATSWSAPPPRTSAPVHSLWRTQRHGTSCRRIYGH